MVLECRGSRRKKSGNKKKDGKSHKKKRTKLVTESVETTKVEISSNPNAQNIDSKSERINLSHSGFDGKTNVVGGSDAAGSAANGNSAMDVVIATDESEVQIIKAKEANPQDFQLNCSSELKIPMPAIERDKKKAKRKRISATKHSEIQLQVNVVDPSQPVNEIISKDKSVGADNGESETPEKNNGKEATSVGTLTDAAHACQADGKHLESAVGTNPSADDNVKDYKLSSATEEINFSDYFVPNQQNPEAVASGDAGNVNIERIAVKENTEVSKVKKKSKVAQVGKKSQVESSQESLSMRQPHGDVLHSDTESFRVPKDQIPSNSAKQKSKSFNNKTKQTTSGAATSQSPRASESQKSTPSREATKLNKTQLEAVSQDQLKEKDETFTASNSTFKSLVAAQQTKSKLQASKKASTAKLKKAERGADRRTALLSTNIFKDDNDESSEDDEAVTSGHSAGIYLDDPNVSDVSETENDTGFATPITVGQRKAAEVDNESSMNKYTLEKLRESAYLEKAKRAQELGIPLEEFVPDSQPDEN